MLHFWPSRLMTSNEPHEELWITKGILESSNLKYEPNASERRMRSWVLPGFAALRWHCWYLGFQLECASSIICDGKSWRKAGQEPEAANLANKVTRAEAEALKIRGAARSSVPRITIVLCTIRYMSVGYFDGWKKNVIRKIRRRVTNSIQSPDSRFVNI